MNPYQVLGVSPSASQEEIREAYLKLVKKYHPDRYQDSNLKKEAEEKMKQINAAYDALTKNPSGASSYGPGSSQGASGSYGSGSYGGYGSYGSGSYGSGSYGGYGSYGPGSYGPGTYGSGSYGTGSYSTRTGGSYSGQYASEFSRVRVHINNGDISAAISLLNTVPLHNAEWQFLYGMCCYRNGQYTRAYEFISRACTMEPSNTEYRSALASMRGAASTGRGWTSSGQNYGLCTTCGSIICLNLCCSACCRGR